MTDTAEWREFCSAAAKDLGLMIGSELLATVVGCGEGGPAERLRNGLERYQAITWRLGALFGPLDGLRVLEIGGGFGGQAASLMGEGATVAIVDLDEARALQDAWLASHGLATSSATGGFDLGISNYALSECPRALQVDYARRLARCPRGYITWNGWIRGEDTLSPEETCVLISGAKLWPSMEGEHPNNRVIVWGVK